MIHLLIFSMLITFTWIPELGGQSQNKDIFAPETIQIFTDRDILISGEDVWFALNCRNEQTGRRSAYSKLAIVEIIAPPGLIVSRVKVSLDNGRGCGSFHLSDALPTGYYTLRAYTRAMRNLGSNSFAYHSMLILHPEQSIALTNDIERRLPTNLHSNEIDIPLNADYPQRSLVECRFMLADPSDQFNTEHFAVSVRLKTPKLPGIAFDSFTEPATLSYSPETEGMLLNGMIRSKNDNSPVAGETLMLSFIGPTAYIYSTQSDEAGRFSFLLPNLYGQQQLVLQTMDRDANDFDIIIDEEFHPIAEQVSGKVVLDRDLFRAASHILENAQIAKAYKVFQPVESYLLDSTYQDIPVYGGADATYRLDDYTRFPLPEFFYEIVPEVRVPGPFGNKRLRMVNDWKIEGLDQSPLLLVDGVPVLDEHIFLKINNRLIHSVDIVTDPFWMNPGVFDGVIHMKSFEGDARSFDLLEGTLRRSFLALLPERKFNPVDYGDGQTNSRPDFRNTLYWNPDVQFNEDGTALISFYTSDVLGTYEVVIMSSKGTSRASFEVRREVVNE